MMLSFSLLRRITPYLQVRKKALVLIYSLSIVELTLAMAQPMIFAYLIDHVLIEKKTEWIIPLLSLSIATALISAGLAVTKAGTIRRILAQNTLDVRDSLTRHIRRIPIWEIERHGAGKFTAMLGYDSHQLANFLNIVTTEILTQFYMLSLALGLLFYMDWRLGLIALSSIGVMLIIPRLYRKPMARYANEVRTHNEAIGSYLYEHIEASKEIRMFGLEEWEQRRNDQMYKSLVRNSTRETVFQVLSNQSSVLVISFIIVMIYWLGSHQVMANALSVGMLVAAVSYLHNVLNPVRAINDTFIEIQRTLVALDRIETFMRIPYERAIHIQETKRNRGTNEQLASVPPPPESAPAIVCEQLHASCYGHHILRGVDLRVPAGHVAAVVGRSGSGKTTLFRTMMGFVDIDSGLLAMNGRSMTDMGRSEICETIGTVFQDTYIVQGTLFENIALGKLDAAYEEVYEAACHANLQEYIDSLPDGLHTRVDHRGFQLSGGQKQRIAIARVFLKKPSILILDEPTSALDRKTEDEVIAALHNVMQGRTTLIATHKLSTMAAADSIHIMENGRIVESGTYEELLQHSDRFTSIMQEKRLEEGQLGIHAPSSAMEVYG